MSRLLFPCFLVTYTLVPTARADTPAVEFNRDIRPILSDKCFVCHGPDAKLRKAKLRLDQEADAFADRGGSRPFVPGKPEQSEAYRRIVSKDKSERMPPAKHGKALTPREVQLVKQWIEQGAKWQGHWSLIPPQRPALPKVAAKSWPLNPIDYFILSRLEREGLKPSPEADRRTQLRRLSFDLTGLPPAPEEVDALLADRSPKAYDTAVERLLSSPHYGERLAIYWLDVVRYADTGGYHSDNHRDLAPYRDWVIDAFNKNLPFDRFTAEQLAGDLLPGGTRAQKIASGYNRLLQTTEEGGAQAKEYTAKYAADRVRNTATAWLGLTMGCAECHSHKFDPITQRDFYSFAAFFADVKERAVGRQEQTLLPTPEQAARLKELEARIAALKPQPKAKTPEQQEIRKQLAELQRQRDQLKKEIPSTLISEPVPPRMVRLLPRGNWLDDSGEVMLPATPVSLTHSPGRIPPKGQRLTRVDLAKWMTASDNPLVARVFVNRLWKLLFGQGIVRTLDDFGSQGAWPTHPELLDWLAVEFRESGWDVKHLVRLMVTSRTYRQTSRVSDTLKQRDPFNHLLARQARFRLDAEMVRDNALAVSGLLSRKVGGPSVKPYQPAGYWAYLNFPRREWAKDPAPEVYRRGLYTYWCRTFLHPSLLAFDAPTREECTVERPRSNTPQQALVLLNDPTYVEAARALAERTLRDGGTETGARLDYLFRHVLGRRAAPDEAKLLTALVERHQAQYAADRAGAEALLRVGDRPIPQGLPAHEVAAWASAARVVLNLHETITRE